MNATIPLQSPPNHRPEWADAKTIQRIFGIGKSTLYRLVDEGKIRSSSLRERGRLRGKRLFSTDSVAMFIESRASGGEDATSAASDRNGLPA